MTAADIFGIGWSLLIVAILLLGLITSRLQRRAWNGGRCRPHGLPWEFFGSDSQGGSGYSCHLGCHTWQSWHHDMAARVSRIARRRRRAS